MKRQAAILGFSATLLFCGCGGGSVSMEKSSSATPPPTSQTSNVDGNWQFRRGRAELEAKNPMDRGQLLLALK